MNQLTIIGNLTRDPETRTTGNGKTVCNFDVAVNKKTADGDKPTYFRVAAWGKTGEVCQQWLEKGRKVAVTGEVSARAYMGKDGEPKCSLEVMANNVEFLSARSAEKPTGGTMEEKGFAPIPDSDLPF